MPSPRILFILLLSATVFTVLFYNESIGLNLLLFEIGIVAWLGLTKQFKLKESYINITFYALLLTSIATVLTNSTFSIFMNFLAFFLFIGVVIYPEVRSIMHSFGLSFVSLVYSQIEFFKKAMGSKIAGKNLGAFLWKYRIFILPLITIVPFVIIYRLSNPIFDKYLTLGIVFLEENLVYLFDRVDLLIVFIFLLGLFISNFIFIRLPDKKLIQADTATIFDLKRERLSNRKKRGMLALLYEYKASFFLLLILNAILLALNIIDINWVWFNFEWEGQYLKQFVHEGTYLLILSILISIAIVLFIFRGNINFYKRNKFLLFLCYLWLAQNAILAVSVAIRNFSYIEHYALAYKRIGVLIFLVLTLYGLYTVFVKVHKQKTAQYLFRTNVMSVFIILVVSSVINWDSFIARYNFAHADRSFLHLEYLSTLSDKALPYLDHSHEELVKLDSIQLILFPMKVQYMNAYQYGPLMEVRKETFKQKWKEKGILSWNFPEHKAYEELNFRKPY